MNKHQHKFEIVSNKQITDNIFSLQLNVGNLIHKVKPGQFINVRVNNSLTPFFRRPFSISRTRKYLEILYEVVGEGTKTLSNMHEGDALDVLAPLGNAFSLPDKDIKRIVIIAGGIGIAPFFFLSDELKNIKAEKLILYGGRSAENICNPQILKSNGFQVFISTDDGSLGLKGRVSKLFSNIKKDLKRTFIYTCGPKPMMKAVQIFAQKNKIEGEVSCEETMACGVGACLGCVCNTTKGYKTVCNDGPVFKLNEIIF